jgi:putative OPT family oligopeptide transporter
MPAKDLRLELTFRGLALGAAMTCVFTAANVYLGLKVGLTFASSIPAAVISMAVLRWFKNSTIYENNIVQTVASAGGTISSIIFVLPGLVMVGWWTGFPFWLTFGVCAIGGTLGVMYTVPLRRAMVTDSDLPYPEGVAAAQVLKVGAGARQDPSGRMAPSAAATAENQAGLMAVLWGSIASAGFYAVIQTRLFAETIAHYFRIGGGATGFGVNLSLALIGAGHLVGLSVGLAMLLGLVISWGIATPILTAIHPGADAAATTATALATGVWRHQVRFIGAGAIGISAIWTLGKLARPVWNGVVSALAASRRTATERREQPRTEQDIPIGVVALVSVACLIPLAALLAVFLSGSALGAMTLPLVLGALAYIVLAGFLVASACGYMAGLIGSSNSPVSGLAILAVIGASLLLAALGRSAGPGASATLVAYALFVTAVLLCVATIANDNLQDLKTGQLVDATPWRQQASLIVGVLAGSLVIPPILDLLNRAYGFAGAPNVTAAGAAHALAAPQATLISALAKGVIQGQIDWGLIGIGVLAGIAVIALDETLGLMRKRRLPPLAVGIGIYLPVGTIVAVVIGAVLGASYERWARAKPNAETLQRLGVLLASGLIVGESLAGVLNAGIIVASRQDAPFADVLRLPADFGTGGELLGGLALVLVVGVLYRWIGTLAQQRR